MDRYQRLALLGVALIVGLFLAFSWTGWSDSTTGLAVLIVAIVLVALCCFALTWSWMRADKAASK